MKWGQNLQLSWLNKDNVFLNVHLVYSDIAYIYQYKEFDKKKKTTSK